MADEVLASSPTGPPPEERTDPATSRASDHDPTPRPSREERTARPAAETGSEPAAPTEEGPPVQGPAVEGPPVQGPAVEGLASLLTGSGATAARLLVAGQPLAAFGSPDGTPSAGHTVGALHVEAWGEPGRLVDRLADLVRVCAAVADRLAAGPTPRPPTEPAVAAALLDSAGPSDEREAASRIARLALPTRPPRLPGYDTAHARAQGRATGGVFVTHVLRGGDLCFAVGRVSGGGLPAALVMTQVKAVVDDALARHGVGRLAEVAAEVTRTVHGSLVVGGRTATLVVGGVLAGSGVVRLYAAGPATVAEVRAGEPQQLATDALPLGVRPSATGVVAELQLDPSSWLLVATDGLLQHGEAADRAPGRQRLTTTLAALDGYSAAVVVRQLLSAIDEQAAGAAAHDQAVLIVRRPPAAVASTSRREPDDTLRLAADLLAIRRLGPWLRELAAKTGTSSSAVARLELALHEVCVNIVEHAYRRAESRTVTSSEAQEPPEIAITLRCWVEDCGWLVEIRDRGDRYDADSRTPGSPTEPQVRGYGLLLVEQLADRLDYRREGPENVWQLQVSL